jgi:hypothetical protein
MTVDERDEPEDDEPEDDEPEDDEPEDDEPEDDEPEDDEPEDDEPEDATAESVAPADPGARPRARAPWGWGVHLVVLLAAAAFALTMWTREDDRVVALGDVTVWDGTPEQVSKIVYVEKRKRVELEAHEDDLGRWFSGVADKTLGAPSDPHNPHAPDEAEDPDAPGTASPEGDADKSVRVEFVSVGAAVKLSEALAPLRALRALGNVGGDRLAEFGLAEPTGTLSVTVSGAEHQLELGDRTPGGKDQYARVTATGEIYVLAGEALRDLEGADQRLMERDLHEWTASEVLKATIVSGDKRRAVVRGGEEGKRFWAPEDAADRQDETIANWMSKVERLRPTRFEPMPDGAETVVRIEYAGRIGQLGFLELSTAPSGEEGKQSYWLLTERLRKPAQINDATAAPIVQDLTTILP